VVEASVARDALRKCPPGLLHKNRFVDSVGHGFLLCYGENPPDLGNTKPPQKIACVRCRFLREWGCNATALLQFQFL
jgi:hypothetical protein